MSEQLEKHKQLTRVRAEAYAELFGCQPSTVFPQHMLLAEPDERILIDVFVYKQATQYGNFEVSVTNGMSDQRMVDADDPEHWSRRELIQYFPKCTLDHAGRLHAMAWLPLFDGFLLDSHHSVAWEYAV